MIMTNVAQRLKSINFFQTTKFSNIDISFRDISLMFVQIFRSYFSEEFFLSSLTEWLSIQVCVCQKHKLINSNQNKKQKANKRKNIYIIYKGSYQAKYLFRAWPFTGQMSSCPSRFCNRKELGPNFSVIKNGPSHNVVG